jgi:hypothetical protein
MYGLRVYIHPVSKDARDRNGVFYSRRADGPYYRWQYEECLGQWFFSRVTHSDDLMLKALCVANWKTVPTALQTRLGEHYLE